MKVGRVASGGFAPLLREQFTEDEFDDRRTQWFERAYPNPVENEAADFAQHLRAANMVASRHMRHPAWRLCGYTRDDVFQVVSIGFLIGLRSWHRRPPNCTSLLSWLIRNANWHCNRERQRLAHFRDHEVATIPRLHPASEFDHTHDRRHGDDSGSTFEIVVSQRAPQQADRSDLALASLAVNLLRNNDRHRLADILEARLFDNLTLQQIADHIGCSRERVRQLEANAVRKLTLDPSFRQQATAHWPNWNPTNADGYHSLKPSFTSKRPPATPAQEPLQKVAAAALVDKLSRARAKANHLRRTAKVNPAPH